VSEHTTAVVSILDKEYQIACSAEERDALHTAAAELDGRMRNIRNSGTIVGLDRIAVMAALNLCHELRQIAQGDESIAAALDTDTLTRLKKKIDKALESS